MKSYHLLMSCVIFLTMGAFATPHPGTLEMVSASSVNSDLTHFKFSDNTGSNATIIFPPGSIAGAQPGDEVGVFNNKGQLAGASVYQGDFMAIAAWGNEPGSGKKDHLAEGMTYRFKIWKKTKNKEYDLSVAFESGPSSYTTNGISTVSRASYNAPAEPASNPTIVLPGSPESTVPPLETNLTHYIYTKNTGANATILIPPGTIKGADVGDEIGVFNKDGKLVGAIGHLAGYNAIAAWGNEANSNDKDHLAEGEAYRFKLYKVSEKKEYELKVTFAAGPSYYTRDGISTVQSGQIVGPVKTEPATPEPATPPTTTTTSDGGDGTEGAMKHFVYEGNTGVNASVIFPPGSILKGSPGDEIGVFNSKGDLTGSGKYTGDYLAIAVWGNETAEGDVMHMNESEPFTFRIWKAATNEEHPLKMTYISGPPFYTANGITMIKTADYDSEAETAGKESVAVSDAIADKMVTFQLDLPESTSFCVCIYNEDGELVHHAYEKKLKSGSSALDVDVSELLSGSYEYRAETAENSYSGSFIKQ